MKSIRQELDRFRVDTHYSLQQARTQKAVANTLLSIINSLGFSHFDVSLIEADRTVIIALTNLPEALLDIYFGEGYYQKDLTVPYLASSKDPVFYSDLNDYFLKSPIETDEIKATLDFKNIMDDYTLFDTYTSKIMQRGDEKLSFSVLAENEKPEKFKRQIAENRTKLRILSEIVYDVVLSKDDLLDRKKQTYSLTDTQLAVLECMAKRSMTQKQTAAHTGLALPTVQAYCHYIKRAMDQRTLAGAVFEAVKRKVITID